MRRPTVTATTGMRHPTPADVEALAALADRAGRPSNAAARAFLASAQRTFAVGYDGRLWVNGATAVTTYDRGQLYRALRHAYRVARALREVTGP